MLYSPMLGASQVSDLKSQSYLKQIKNIASENKAIFCRAEFDIPATQDFGTLGLSDYIKAFEEMQPEHTLILDIDRTEAEILEQMKPKGRYNIRVAERSGIIIEKTDSVREFFQLYQIMAKRQKITYRNEQYFQKLVDILKEKDYVQVFLAREARAPHESTNGTTKVQNYESSNESTSQRVNESTILAAAIVTYYDKRATYLFGGSSSKHRELMAPYKLHWEIIKDAKTKGCVEYDFFGIAPDNNPKHPWAGVTRFKKQFGGRQVDLLGSYDLVFNKTKYQLFKMAEKIRR